MTEFVDILIEKIESDPELTESGLAKKAGLNDSTIRQMIKFRRSPRIDTAVKICGALNTTVEEFLSQSSDPIRTEILHLLDQLSDIEKRVLLAAGRGMRDEAFNDTDQ